MPEGRGSGFRYFQYPTTLSKAKPQDGAGMTENLKPHPPTFPDRCGNTWEQKEPLPGLPRCNPGAYMACREVLSSRWACVTKWQRQVAQLRDQRPFHRTLHTPVGCAESTQASRAPGDQQRLLPLCPLLLRSLPFSFPSTSSLVSFPLPSHLCFLHLFCPFPWPSFFPDPSAY